MRIALLSDTHGFVDPAIPDYLSECDEVWHAGDLGPDVLDRLKAIRPFRGVYGNIDGPDVRAELPEDLDWRCENVHVYMTHIGGHPGRYDKRAKREILAHKPDLFICGHSHIPRIDRDPALGLIHMNPGACGHAGWHLKRTMLRFSIVGDRLTGVEVIELGPRGRR